MSLEANHTKSGPGRKHSQCLLRFDAGSQQHFKRKPAQRLAPANLGGNWKGKEYFSYREADRIRLLQLAGTHLISEAIAAVRAERVAA